MTKSKNIFIVSISSFFFILLLINNIVYDAIYTINQSFLNLCILTLLVVLVLKLNLFYKDSIKYIVIIYIFFIYGLFLATDQYILNRNINYSLIMINFILLFYFSKYFILNENIFNLYIVIFIAIAILILISDNRHIINPNWVAMTFFYMIALARPKKIVLFFILGLILSFFVYESRGASLSFIAALVSYFIIKIDHRIVRIGIVIVIFTVSILFFLFLDFATQEGPEAALLIVSQFSERGLAGREGALFYGYDLLKQSDFLGYGIWFSGGFEVVVNKLRGLEMIHIHYGLLDLALKFSIFTVILFLLALPFYIKKVTTESLPYVAGGLITIFYYNGLAPSHLGLNILLYLILGQAIMIHSKEIFK